MKDSAFFDRIISSDQNLQDLPYQNLGELLFNRSNRRDEQSIIILSHIGNNLVKIDLPRLRIITRSLMRSYKHKKLEPGQTVMLANISGNHELFLALHFLALTTYGIRVLLPMFMETEELEKWVTETTCQSVFVPEMEIKSRNHHEKEKTVLKTIKQISAQNQLSCWDIMTDFRLKDLIFQEGPPPDMIQQNDLIYMISQTNPETQALLITTSGSSGRSKLVAYNHQAYIRNCQSWEIAGFYQPDQLGGRGFTPLFAHTMGIRALINALWTGYPVCLINTEYFTEKPEVVRYFIQEMKPQHVTGGPAIYALLLELMRNFPELKEILSEEFQTLVSSGAPMNPKTIKEVEAAFGLKLHNAYGTTETQQALSTMLLDDEAITAPNDLGSPLPGVSIGLKKMSAHTDQYRLYIRSPFGMIEQKKKPATDRYSKRLSRHWGLSHYSK